MERQLIELTAAQMHEKERMDRVEGIVEDLAKDQQVHSRENEKSFNMLTNATEANAAQISTLVRVVFGAVALCLLGIGGAILKLVLR